VKARFLQWSPAGEALWVQTNERDPRFFDLYRYDAKTYVRTLAYKDETGCALGAMKPLHQGRGAYSPEDFDPASQALYYLTNEGSEFTRVRRYDIAGGRHETSRGRTGT
jgi:hypothetical protein